VTDVTSATAGRNWWNLGLWVTQVLLAAFYAMAAFFKLTQPMESLAAAGMTYATDYPELLTRFVGTVEALGVLGIMLPAATRVMPWLTPLAAAGFSLVQVAAIILHASRGETATTLPMNLVLLALSLFVLWGRWRKAPIEAR
jgi:putative oxidoreductase